MGHHVVGGEQSFLGKKYDSPVQTGAALEQVFAQSSNAKAGMEVRTAKPIGERAEAIRNLPPIVRGEFLHTLLEARVEIDLHRVPVKGFVRREACDFLTSAFTLL